MDLNRKYEVLDKILWFLPLIENLPDSNLEVKHFITSNKITIEEYHSIISYLLEEGYIKEKIIQYVANPNINHHKRSLVQSKTMFFEGFVRKHHREIWQHRRVVIESIAVIVGGASAFGYYFILPFLQHYHIMPKIYHLFDCIFLCQ